MHAELHDKLHKNGRFPYQIAHKLTVKEEVLDTAGMKEIELELRWL